MPREGAYEEAWILPPRFSHAYLRRALGACIDPLFRLPRVRVGAINDVPLLGDDPADAIRSASATSASAISS